MPEWEARDPHYITYSKDGNARSFHADDRGVVQITEEALLTIMTEAGWKYIDPEWVFPDEPTA